ncbi:very short patch repair endonuclease [Bradyrhizobium sp. 521_C7_N1_3]|uniref:very short patch repair endonuclease n=1 Tax=Bradyrhizobium sp. 521_C7_N1_3 TaxID=3240368 RepID=UPI003F8BBA93
MLKALANPRSSFNDEGWLEPHFLADIVSKAKRSSMMAAVRQRHTKPELNLRQALHRVGLRYRLHRKDLPGTPDIVFVRSRLAVFVNGCFWHRHSNCPKATMPKLRASFWRNKFERNVARDLRAQALLRAMGWKVVVVWECQVKSSELASKVAQRFLRARRTPRGLHKRGQQEGKRKRNARR